MENSVKTYISEKILRGQVDIGNETSLYKSGLISSLSHMKLMNYLERTFSVNMASACVNMDDFDTVSKIVQSIQSHREAQHEEVLS